jgi:hypothetical protein
MVHEKVPPSVGLDQLDVGARCMVQAQNVSRDDHFAGDVAQSTLARPQHTRHRDPDARLGAYRLKRNHRWGTPDSFLAGTFAGLAQEQGISWKLAFCHVDFETLLNGHDERTAIVSGHLRNY